MFRLLSFVMAVESGVLQSFFINFLAKYTKKQDKFANA